MSIFDTIWRKRGRPTRYQPEESDEVVHYIITQTERDYSGLLEDGDVAIKFWLPELMALIIDESRAVFATSRSDLIRQILFTYLYGRYDWLGMHERRETHYQLEPESMPMFSRRASSGGISEPAPDLVKDLGKNSADLKVWIPRKMKDDIQALADKLSISLSEMIREIIISSLIGHTYLSARNELLQMKIEVEIETPK